jgi:hypothetical protein
MKAYILPSCLILVCTLFLACSTSDSSSPKFETLGKEYLSTYICPLNCEGSGSDEDGRCPTCRTPYIKSDLHGHAEDFSYEEEFD